MIKSKYIYYFGYGSNMSINYLNNRRRVFPKESIVGRLNGFKIIMNMEGPNFLEPSFANITKDKFFFVEGILHKITKDELTQIINSEGENYEVVDIFVNHGKTSKKATTLIYKTDNKESIPSSRRYMKILISAALQSNFSPNYIQKLKNHPNVYFPFLSEIFSVFIFFWVWYKSRVKT